MKQFKLGFMVGRMQPIHKGHQQLIDLGLEVCERFVILLGSSDEFGTRENPFTFEQRARLINQIYGDRVEVYPIVNIGIGYTKEWGNYLVNTIKLHCGVKPDFYIGGVEVNRNEIFVNYPEITILYISRNKINISGTEIRDELNFILPGLCRIDNIKETLRKYVDEKIIDTLLEYKGYNKDIVEFLDNFNKKQR